MLFEPFTFTSGLVVRNRLALAPLTNQQSLADGQLGDDELAFLARRADGGFGVVSTCASYVALDGKAWPGQLAIDRDELLPGLTKLADRLRGAGAAAIVQLFHGGVRASSKLTGHPVWSASTWHEDAPAFEAPRPATRDDLARVIDQFVAAARRANRAGFDGVELHGAHGYLLSQFLSATMNPRDDGWGGDLVGRARLVREVLRACRAALPRTFTIGVRLSLEDYGFARGLDLDDSLQVVRWLCDDGADFIHVSLWDAAQPTRKRPHEHPATLARAAMNPGVALLAAGSVWTPDEASALIGRGADLVALGRAAIVNPDWPRGAASDGWQPRRPPVTRGELLDRAVSPVFATYLTRWKGFVAD